MHLLFNNALSSLQITSEHLVKWTVKFKNKNYLQYTDIMTRRLSTEAWNRHLWSLDELQWIGILQIPLLASLSLHDFFFQNVGDHSSLQLSVFCFSTTFFCLCFAIHLFRLCSYLHFSTASLDALWVLNFPNHLSSLYVPKI